MRILAAVAGVIVVGGLFALVLVRLSARTASERSFSAIHVAGYQQTARLDASGDGGTTWMGIYIGPPVASSNLGRIVTGPGVRVTVLVTASHAVAYPGTVEIARGAAPQKCGLEIDQFLKGARPYSWFGVTPNQLRRVRTGRRDILLIWTVCGTG